MDALEKLSGFRLRAGRLWGVEIWLHWTLLAAAVWAFFYLRETPQHAAMLVLVLVGSVLAHELGHCWGARRVGGEAREVVLWPLGGLAHLQTPHTPAAQLVSTAAGPLVNVLIALFALVPFLLLGGSWSFDTLSPAGGPLILGMIMGVNVTLAFFNLIPAYPMDGGRILQAALWPRFGLERATSIAVTAALIVSGMLGAWAIATSQWLLLGIMLMIAFSALAERARMSRGDARQEDLVWPETSDADDGPPPQGRFAAWRERRRLRREEEETRACAEMRARLDDVLAKVTECGLDGLTKEERRFLDQASLMLRREQESGKR